MRSLIAAALLFLGIHLAVSGTRLRDRITAAIGEKLYIPLFAVASLVAIVWLCVAYNRFFATPTNILLFDAGSGVRALAIPVMFAALMLAAPGVMMGNPTSAGQDKANVTGVLRITRHPYLCGVTLWSGFHLIAGGTLADTILFATFLILALLGTKAIDRKVARKRPAEWEKIAAQTSIIPFAAIIGKRNRFEAREYFDWRFSVAVVVFACLLAFHNSLFGMSPFPNGWLPGSP